MRGTVELRNEKQTLPSFSLKSGRNKEKRTPARRCFWPRRFIFPTCRERETVRQSVPLRFARRGLYRQEAFRIVTRFPFGFLQKARRLDIASEALVYPSVEATAEFLDVLPGIQGAMESLAKGRGQDFMLCATIFPRIA